MKIPNSELSVRTRTENVPDKFDNVNEKIRGESKTEIYENVRLVTEKSILLNEFNDLITNEIENFLSASAMILPHLQLSC